jgi:hypothetical protein
LLYKPNTSINLLHSYLCIKDRQCLSNSRLSWGPNSLTGSFSSSENIGNSREPQPKITAINIADFTSIIVDQAIILQVFSWGLTIETRCRGPRIVPICHAASISGAVSIPDARLFSQLIRIPRECLRSFLTVIHLRIPVFNWHALVPMQRLQPCLNSSFPSLLLMPFRLLGSLAISEPLMPCQLIRLT